jgi:hypothetical protein
MQLLVKFELVVVEDVPNVLLRIRDRPVRAVGGHELKGVLPVDVKAVLEGLREVVERAGDRVLGLASAVIAALSLGVFLHEGFQGLITYALVAEKHRCLP